MILTEPNYAMHGLPNLPTVSTSSSMLVPVQLVVNASAGPQTPIGQQYCTIVLPGSQVRGSKRAGTLLLAHLSVTPTLGARGLRGRASGAFGLFFVLNVLCLPCIRRC
jgi:hypothetical protein